MIECLKIVLKKITLYIFFNFDSSINEKGKKNILHDVKIFKIKLQNEIFMK